MIAVEDTALVLLAAGRSERFGASKLDAVLDGRALGLHVVAALAGLPFRGRVAVTGRGAIDYAAQGFSVVRNEDGGTGMASSLRLGVAAAEAAGAAAVLVVLADMPRVTAGLVGRVLAASDGADLVAASDGARAMPPALFGRGRFAELLALEGEAGARGLLRAARRVEAAPGELADVDIPADLTTLAPAVR